jgi:hypothetical protein
LIHYCPAELLMLSATPRNWRPDLRLLWTPGHPNQCDDTYMSE